MSELQERTFIAIKPDGVQRGIIGEIIKRFEMKGFKLVGMKMVQASEDLLMKHYIDLKDRPFFPTLVNYMSSGPVVAMVWEGKGVVKTGRVMLGETNPPLGPAALPPVGLRRPNSCLKTSWRTAVHGPQSSWHVCIVILWAAVIPHLIPVETFHPVLDCVIDEVRFPVFVKGAAFQ
uniref:Nucleoside diphosphate kinase B n=1 Tax=Oryzias latipes TaxID=8090 RepID=H2MIF0_ORYLA